MLRGRIFTDDDGLKMHVAIVNEAMARKFFGGQDPIGRQIRYTGGSGPILKVVGIVRNIKEGRSTI